MGKNEIGNEMVVDVLDGGRREELKHIVANIHLLNWQREASGLQFDLSYKNREAIPQSQGN